MAILGKTTLLSGECYNNFKIGGTLLLQTDGLSNIPSVTTSDKNVVQADGYVVAKGFKISGNSTITSSTAGGYLLTADGNVFPLSNLVQNSASGKYVSLSNEDTKTARLNFNVTDKDGGCIRFMGITEATENGKFTAGITGTDSNSDFTMFSYRLTPTTGFQGMLFQSSQEIYLGNTNLVVDVQGNKISAMNGFYQTSDKRKKTNFRDLDLNKCYEMIEKCQTVLFDWKDGSGKDQMGVIAQEVEEFFPEIVSTDENGYKSVDYAKLAVVCMRVLKDLIDKVNGQTRSF